MESDADSMTKNPTTESSLWLEKDGRKQSEYLVSTNPRFQQNGRSKVSPTTSLQQTWELVNINSVQKSSTDSVVVTTTENLLFTIKTNFSGTYF